MAFNSKNLHYDKNEPAFLRKLRGDYGSNKQTFQAARPKRERLANDDDDGPAIVDEEGATISKEEYEALVNGKKTDVDAKTINEEQKMVTTGKGKEDAVDEVKGGAERDAQKMADVGAVRKRKQVKVVGKDEEEKEDLTKEQKPKSVKKHRKKVKLSFDEPDE